jgi:hypothetical protein
MRTGLAEGRQYLATHPLCVKCMAVGRYTKATVVDHIEGNYDLTYDIMLRSKGTFAPYIMILKRGVILKRIC